MLQRLQSSIPDNSHDLDDSGDEAELTRGSSGSRVSSDTSLHRAAFENDLPAIQASLNSSADPHASLRSFDVHGNTPLHIAVFRGHRAVVEALLAAGAEAGSKNARRWNSLDEAIALEDRELCRLLLVHLRQEWKQKKAAKKALLLQTLRELPDFRLKLKWDLGSAVLGPLVRQFAPDDCYTIAKVGTCMRIDGTLMGLDRGRRGLTPHWNRGSFSLYVDPSPAPAPRLFANHERRWFVDLYKERKERRKDVDREVDLLLKHGGEKVAMRTANAAFRPATTWLGRPALATVDHWHTQVFEWSGDMVAVSRQKAAVKVPAETTWDEYLAMPMPEDVVSETELDPEGRPAPERSWFKKAQRAGQSSRAAASAGSARVRRITTRCWMAKDFPMPLRQLVPLLEALGETSRHFEEAAAFMRRWSEQDLFPVKIQVPLMWTVHLTMKFKEFELLGDDDPARDPSYFQVPSEYEETSVEAIRGRTTMHGDPGR